MQYDKNLEAYFLLSHHVFTETQLSVIGKIQLNMYDTTCVTKTTLTNMQ